MNVGDEGFGSEVCEALRQRAGSLVEKDWPSDADSTSTLARNLLATLRERELVATTMSIAAETGLKYRRVADGQCTTGLYRRSVMLAGGCYAMLDDWA